MKPIPTVRLFEEDPYLKTFEARILNTTETEGKTAVVLDRTAFYPASGGQPCDGGTLNGIPVIDVTEDEENIVHRVDGKLNEDAIQGEIDWSRRFDHMQQHTGQHILSQAFFRGAGAMTVGFHMGNELSTIDLAELTASDELIRDIESMANAIVFEDRSVQNHLVKKEQIESVPLRKPPAVGGDIRVVEIEDFDHVACCGTHVRRAGEVGLIKILRYERYKGGTRVTFVCGKRALDDYAQKTTVLRETCRQLTVGEEELLQTVIRWKEDKKSAARQLAHLRITTLQTEAAELIQKVEHVGSWQVVKRSYGDREPDEVKQLTKELIKKDSVIALIALKTGGGLLFFGRSPDVDVDLSVILKEVFKEIEGRGGGQNAFAQGSCAELTRIDDALDLALELIKSKAE